MNINTNCNLTPKYTGMDVLDKKNQTRYWFDYENTSFAVVIDHCNNSKSLVNYDVFNIKINKKQEHLVNLENDLFLAFNNLPVEDKMI